MALNREWIETRIPHRQRMCLLDQVMHWDDGGIRCLSRTHLDPHNPLRLGAQLHAACGIEYAAQAMALHGALCAEAAGGTTARAGFLASVRDVRLLVARLDDIQHDLLCEVSRLAGDSGSALYSFTVSAEQRPLLSGRATVILNPESAP